MALSCTFTKTNEVFLFSQDLFALLVLPIPDIRSLCLGLNPGFETNISIAAVEELTYRQSRLCRLLGHPVAFAVIPLLANGKDPSTGEIAKLIGRSVPRTSNILGLEACRGSAV